MRSDLAIFSTSSELVGSNKHFTRQEIQSEFTHFAANYCTVPCAIESFSVWTCHKIEQRATDPKQLLFDQKWPFTTVSECTLRLECTRIQYRLAKGCTFFHNFDEVRPVHRTGFFGHNGAGTASDSSTLQILCTPCLWPSSSCKGKVHSAQKVTDAGAQYRSTERDCFCVGISFFPNILGCQVGGVAPTWVQCLRESIRYLQPTWSHNLCKLPEWMGSQCASHKPTLNVQRSRCKPGMLCWLLLATVQYAISTKKKGYVDHTGVTAKWCLR